MDSTQTVWRRRSAYGPVSCGGAARCMEGLLRGEDFLLGGQFIAADCVSFPFIKYAALGMPPGDDKLFHRILVERQPIGDSHPLLIAWINRVDALPRA